MEDYLNLGPRSAAQDSISMEHPDFTDLDLTELDNIARQLEWDNLNAIDTMTTHFSEQSTSQQDINSNLTMEQDFSSHYHQYHTSKTFLYPPGHGSPDTSTAASVLDTPPMPDFELPADWTATWGMDTLDMNLTLSDFQLDTELQWPTMDSSWFSGGLGSVDTWTEPLQYQQPKESALSYDLPHDITISTSSTTSTSPAETTSEGTFTCSFCSFTATSITKLKTHTNKHTRPFRCTAPSCDYATAEKKSLQRHVLAKAKWDEGHRIAAETLGVREVKYRCPGVGCEYVTIREDNLRRHVAKCPAKV